MSRSSNAVRGIATRPSIFPRSSPKICQSCLRQQRLNSTAVAPNTSPHEEQLDLSSNTHPVSTPKTTYKITTSVLLSRPPILTRDLTSFEKAYFLYQRRLNERLALPFTRYFYYQRGTPGDVEWKRKILERKTPARDIGVYNAYDRETGWFDEVLVGAKESEPEHQIEALVQDAESEIKLKEELAGGREEEEAKGAGTGNKKHIQKIQRPLPRVTEADKAGDLKSLDRALTRTLYLLVKGGGKWGFPTSSLERRESLHTAAERTLIQSCGLNMNTWVVGNMPIGHRTFMYPPQPKSIHQDQSDRELGEKTFYMKARIMAGQADLKGNKFGLEDFVWLAKDEIQGKVEKNVWNRVKNILLSR